MRVTMQVEVRIGITRKVSYDRHNVVMAVSEAEIVDDLASADALQGIVRRHTAEVLERVSAQLDEREAIQRAQAAVE